MDLVYALNTYMIHVHVLIGFSQEKPETKFLGFKLLRQVHVLYIHV